MRIAHRPSCRLAFAALVAASSPAMAQNIDTGTPPIGSNPPIFAFGRASAVSFSSLGQSFLVPVGGPTQLDAFEFWLRDNTVAGTTPFYAYIFDFDPVTRRTGNSYLFRSAAVDYTGVAGPTAFTFSTGGLGLVAGNSYLAALSTVEFAGAPVGERPGAAVSSNWPTDVYTGGMSFVRNGPGGLATIAGTQWGPLGGTGVDLAFRATLSSVVNPTPVPEPTTVALVGLGVLAIGAAARRRA